MNIIPAHWIGAFANFEKYGLRASEALVSLPPEKLRKHAWLCGASGSGKSCLTEHIIAQCVRTRESFVVLDHSGDRFNASLEIASAHVDPAIFRTIDLRSGAKSAGFDPLGIGSGEPYHRALHMLEAVESQGSTGPQIREYSMMAFRLLAETGHPLTDIERLFYNDGFRMTLVNQCPTECIRDFWSRFDSNSADRKAMLASPVTNKVSTLTETPATRDVLGKYAPLHLRKHLDTRGSVLLVCTAIHQTHAAGRMLGSLLISAICREVFAREDTPEGKRNQVTLVVDEFQNYEFSNLETILAEGRKYRIGLVLANQVLAQLSPTIRSLLRNNISALAVFRTGREDSSTLNRDLTGDPNTFNFPNFPVGRAVLWTAGEDPVEIDVNEPLVWDAGSLSPRAQRYLKEVHALQAIQRETGSEGSQGAFSLGDVAQGRSQASSTPVQPPAARDQDHSIPLDEWLTWK